jgi:RNA polymerase sigma factor for flagellar operon FliA
MRGLARYRVEDETEALVSRHAALVKRIAYHLAARLPDSVRVDDLIQAGMLGLLEAARRYDPAQGASFATFAERRIRGAMLDEIRKGDWTPRSVHRKAREVAAAIRAVENAKGGEARDPDIAAQLGLSLADYHKTLADLRGQKLLSIEALESDEKEGVEHLASFDQGPAERVQQEQLLKGLAAAIAELPERERLVLSLYYDEGLNLKEIGAVLAVSESRVSQLHSQALVRLRARVNG